MTEHPCAVVGCGRTDTALCDVWDQYQLAWLCPTDARRLRADPHDPARPVETAAVQRRRFHVDRRRP